MKKIFKWALIIAMSSAYCIFIILKINKLPMNSDSAGMLLYAEDILSGNIFLSGWYLTGLTFLTTDLPFFIIGVAIAGVGLNAFRIAVALMYFFMVGCSLPLVFCGVKDKKLAFAYLAAIGLFPTTYALSNTFVHTACFALMFLAIYLSYSYDKDAKKTKLVMFAIVTALAVAGDHMAFALITLPIVVLCLLKKFKHSISVLSGVVIGSIFGVLIEALYIFIGNAELNSLSRTSFTDIHSVAINLQVYIEYVLKLIDASFFGKNIFSIKTAAFALKIALALFAVYIIVKSVKRLFMLKKSDIPTCALSIGFIVVSLILWLTDFSIDITAGRYIAYLPLMLAVVLARANIDYTITAKTGLFLVCIMLALSNLVPRGSDFSPYNTYSALAEFLENENLSYGYAPFWDSLVINGYSGNRVKVSPVRNTEQGIAPRLWFSRADVYKEKTTFFLMRRSDADDEEQLYNYNGIYNIFLGTGKTHGKTYELPLTYDAIISSFGEPEAVKTFRNYDILIYNDLSDKLVYE